MELKLKLLQWNISNRCKIDKIADFILSNIDGHTIICLQEVIASHKNRLIEHLAPSDYAYSLDYREPGCFDGNNRKMGVLTLLFGGKVEEAKVLDRCLFPDRTLYTNMMIGEESVSILNFHSITGVSYKVAKGSNFASIAEFLYEKEELDFFCCDANEPDVDSFDVNEVKFWNPNGNGREASLIFGKDTVHHLSDPVQCDDLGFEALPFSYMTGKIPRRYDFIYKSDRWATKSFNFYYNESVEASSDHAMVVGVFNRVNAGSNNTVYNESDKEFYLKQLKYFKGEMESPFDDNMRSMLWSYESVWFNYMTTKNKGVLDEYISDFKIAGLDDLPGDVPLGYKAILFNRYRKGSMTSIFDTAKQFREFFAKYY